MIMKILNFLTVTLREIEEEKSRWPELKVEIKSRRMLLALTCYIYINIIIIRIFC